VSAADDACCCYLGHERLRWSTLHRECRWCGGDLLDWARSSGRAIGTNRGCSCRQAIADYVLTNHKFRAFPTSLLYTIELDPSLGPPLHGTVGGR
jgi:hypothetical protein